MLAVGSGIVLCYVMGKGHPSYWKRVGHRKHFTHKRELLGSTIPCSAVTFIFTDLSHHPYAKQLYSQFPLGHFSSHLSSYQHSGPLSSISTHSSNLKGLLFSVIKGAGFSLLPKLPVYNPEKSGNLSKVNQTGEQGKSLFYLYPWYCLQIRASVVVDRRVFIH